MNEYTEKFLCEDNKYRYIYKITINTTQEYYIGKHSTNNLNDGYMGSGVAVNEYYDLSGYNDISKEILCYTDNENDLLLLESKYIGDKWKTYPLCLNRVPGGTFCWTWKNDKRFPTQEDYINFCKENTKRWMESLTDEEYKQQCQKISDSLKEYYKTHTGTFLGRKHSDETKKINIPNKTK